MAVIDWELNFFTADPRQVQPQEERDYERAAATLAACASPIRLKLLHAIALGEATPVRAACWARVPQALAEVELRELASRGVLEREPTVPEVAYRPADGHVVVLVAIAVAHGAHGAAERARHPLLLRDRRRIAGTRIRDGK